MPSSNIPPANWHDGDETAPGFSAVHSVLYMLSTDDGVSWSAGVNNPAHLVATKAQFSKITGQGYIETLDPAHGCQATEWWDQDYQAGSYAQLRVYEYLDKDQVQFVNPCAANTTIYEHQEVNRIVQDRAGSVADGQFYTGVI